MSTIFTQIRVTLYEKDKTRAFASCKIADVFYLTGLKVIEGKNGLFVSMPSRKTTEGEYQDVCFPASKAIRDELQTAVLDAYDAEIAIGAEAQLAQPPVPVQVEAPRSSAKRAR